MILVLCVTFAYAQKGKVTQATSYFTSGKLDEAKKLIDEAIKHEACVAFDKAYFVKGQIYQAIYESPIADYKKLDPNALEVAWEAFQKVIELDVKKKYEKKLEAQYRNLIIDFNNRAVEYYNSNDFKNALVAFKKVLEIENSPLLLQGGPAIIDTALIYNAGVAAQRAGAWEEAEKFYKQTLKNDYKAGEVYAMLSNVLKEQGKKDEAIKYLHEGYEKYPDNSYMLVELINHYLFGGEPEKAEIYLDAAIKQDPKNASFYRAKGTLYEKMGQFDKAEEVYKIALEINPQDFMAQYNFANIQLTKVSEFHSKVSNIVDVNEYNKELEKVYEGYESVVPYYEKALEILEANPVEENKENAKITMTVLKELYFKLRNKDPKYQQKYDEVKAKLDVM